jgi:hypothetical protein
MEMSQMTPARHIQNPGSYGRAVDAFDTVAFRPTATARFKAPGADASDDAEPTLKQLIDDLPAWVTVAAGGVAAAAMGVMLGGALHI